MSLDPKSQAGITVGQISVLTNLSGVRKRACVGPRKGLDTHLSSFFFFFVQDRKGIANAEHTGKPSLL